MAVPYLKLRKIGAAAFLSWLCALHVCAGSLKTDSSQKLPGEEIIASVNYESEKSDCRSIIILLDKRFFSTEWVKKKLTSLSEEFPLPEDLLVVVFTDSYAFDKAVKRLRSEELRPHVIGTFESKWAALSSIPNKEYDACLLRGVFGQIWGTKSGKADSRYFIEPLPRSRIPYVSNDPYENMLAAINNNDVSKAGELLEQGFPVNHQDQHGWTPLMYACRAGKEEIVAFLLRKGADVKLRSQHGMDSLILASIRSNSQIVLMLLSSGASANSKNNAGDSALMFACSNDGDLKIIEALLKAGAEVNAQDDRGGTSLTMATVKGHVKAVRLLLEYGADPLIRTYFGETALDIAKRKGQAEIVKLFEHNPAK